jgi:hypothetical protein
MERARTAVAAAVAFAFAARAAAHEERTPKREELRLSPSEARLRIAYAVPAGDLAGTLSRLFDRDRDGVLSLAERAELARHLVREALAFLRLSVDGKPVVVALSADSTEALAALLTREARPDGEVAVTFEAGAPLALGGGAHAIELRDRHKDRRVVIPVRVSLAPPLRWRHRPAPLPTVDEKHPLVLEIEAP